jgi:hypothetical protein
VFFKITYPDLDLLQTLVGVWCLLDSSEQRRALVNHAQDCIGLVPQPQAPARSHLRIVASNPQAVAHDAPTPAQSAGLRLLKGGAR